MSIVARASTHPRVDLVTTASPCPVELPAVVARRISDHRDLISYGTLAAGIEAAIIAVGYTTGGPIVGAVLGSLLPGLVAVTGSAVAVCRWSVDRHAQAVSDDYRATRDPSA